MQSKIGSSNFKLIEVQKGISIRAFRKGSVVRFRIADGEQREGTISVAELEKQLRGIAGNTKLIRIKIDSQKIEISVAGLRKILGE